MDKYIGKICPYCKTAIQAEDDIIICSRCEMPHHKDCWIENQGCTTFGCSGTIQSPDPIPSTPSQEPYAASVPGINPYQNTYSAPAAPVPVQYPAAPAAPVPVQYPAAPAAPVPVQYPAAPAAPVPVQYPAAPASPAPVQYPAAAPVGTANPISPEFRYCTKCGARNLVGNSFCTKCGNRL